MLFAALHSCAVKNGLWMKILKVLVSADYGKLCVIFTSACGML